MKNLKLITLIAVAALFAGCASLSKQESPTFGDMQTGEATYYVKLVFGDTGAVTPSTADTMFLKCKGTGTGMGEVIDMNDTAALEAMSEGLDRCERVAEIAHDAAPGALPGFVAPVVQSSAIAAAGYFIGDGIKNQQPDTYTDNSVVNSDNKQGQAQGQGQGQLQGQAQGQHQSSYNSNRNSNRNSNYNSNRNSNRNSNYNNNSNRNSNHNRNRGGVGHGHGHGGDDD